MEISERGLGATLASAEVGAREVGWFAVRQPGIVRFLEAGGKVLLAPVVPTLDENFSTCAALANGPDAW